MDITQVIYETLEANEALDLLPLVRWEWNTRLTAAMGRYFPRMNGQRNHRRSGLIEFSPALFGRAKECEQAETVAHEVCHMIVDHQAPKATPHGWEWQQAMLKAGYAPKRTHNIDRTGLRRRQARVRLYCGCAEGCIITKSLYTRSIRNGEYVNGVSTRRVCKRCRQPLRLRR